MVDMNLTQNQLDDLRDLLAKYIRNSSKLQEVVLKISTFIQDSVHEGCAADECFYKFKVKIIVVNGDVINFDEIELEGYGNDLSRAAGRYQSRWSLFHHTPVHTPCLTLNIPQPTKMEKLLNFMRFLLRKEAYCRIHVNLIMTGEKVDPLERDTPADLGLCSSEEDELALMHRNSFRSRASTQVLGDLK